MLIASSGKPQPTMELTLCILKPHVVKAPHILKVRNNPNVYLLVVWPKDSPRGGGVYSHNFILYGCMGWHTPAIEDTF